MNVTDEDRGKRRKGTLLSTPSFSCGIPEHQFFLYM